MPRKPSKKRRADGRFRVVVDGVAFHSYTSWADANRQAKAYAAEKELGMHTSAKRVTIRAYAQKWLPIYKSGVKDRTYDSYASLLNKLVAYMGDVPLSEATPDDVRTIYATLFPAKKGSDEGYSGSMIRKAKGLYTALFDAAVENGYADRNPFRSSVAKPDIGDDGTHRPITDEERSLIHTVKHSFRPAVMVMLYAGLRRGEALALDLDQHVRDGVIYVEQAISYKGNRPIVDTPKTDAGTRTIPVFPPLAEELEGLHGLLAPSKTKGDYMSETAFSRAWESYCVAMERELNGSTKRWYGLTKADQAANPQLYAQIQRLKARGDIEAAEKLRLATWKTFTVRPHDLRHSFCVMCRDAGVDIKQTIAWMGHADEKMILRIYDHVTTRRTAESVQKVTDSMKILTDKGQNKDKDHSASSESLDTQGFEQCQGV